MSSNTTDHVVAEYLRELESRLGGLPVLQRRELLADVEAHIANERVERSLATEAEVLEMLERLGSPEVVAAAAYEEAEMSGGQPLVSAGRQSSPDRHPVSASVSPAGVVPPAYAPPAPAVAPVVPPPPDPPVFGAPQFAGFDGGSAGPGLLTELGDAVDGLFLGRFAHDPVSLETVLDEAAVLAIERAEGLGT